MLKERHAYLLLGGAYQTMYARRVVFCYLVCSSFPSFKLIVFFPFGTTNTEQVQVMFQQCKFFLDQVVLRHVETCVH